MRIINYQLKKVSDCDMRDESGKMKACWFYLADSYYHLQLGSTKIYEYTTEVIKKFKLANQFLD